MDLETTQHSNRDFSWEEIGVGDYRHLIVMPKRLNWQLVRYEHPDEVTEVGLREGRRWRQAPESRPPA